MKWKPYGVNMVAGCPFPIISKPSHPRFAAADFRAVSLGPRILRSEVATVAALADDLRG